MILPKYYASVSKELQHQSQRIRDSFKSHKPTAGSNREAIITEFLKRHLPRRFGIGEGLIISRNDQVSNQADTVIYDQQYNAPLHPDLPSTIFLVESVFSLLECKTNLTPTELSNSISKCRKFKTLERRFETAPIIPKIRESLIIIFALNAANPIAFKSTFAEQLKKVPISEQPDLIVIPGNLVVKSGHYYGLAKLGQPNSPHWDEIAKLGPEHGAKLIAQGFDIYNFGEHSLLVFLIWFTSWLQRAGNRAADPITYLPDDAIWGHKV